MIIALCITMLSQVLQPKRRICLDMERFVKGHGEAHNNIASTRLPKLRGAVWEDRVDRPVWLWQQINM
jgi:hypothetical protein